MTETMTSPNTKSKAKTRYSAATNDEHKRKWAVVATKGRKRTVLITGLTRAQAQRSAAELTGSPICAHTTVEVSPLRTRCSWCGHVEITDIAAWVTVKR